MSRFRISRRQLLGAAATTAVAGLVLARETRVPVAAGAEPPPSDRAQPAAAAWLDPMLSADERAQACAALAPLQPSVLELDIVWQWRRELAQQLGKGLRAVAITRWDKAILLNDLAREAALPVRQRRIGHSLFQTEIG
jgi:hypothetical protein